MKYRKLGNTDLSVSEISLGCSGYWGHQRFDQTKAIAIVRTAYDHGINFFDTGHNYSNFNAEPRLGIAIREILAQHDRSSLVISSKGGSLRGSAPILPTSQKPAQDFSPDAIEESCRRSIANLGCEYLDVFQLHGIIEAAITPSLLERLSQMRESGLFRYLGINTHDSKTMRFLASKPGLCDMVLIDYNVLQLDREPLIQQLAQANVGVVAGTILAQGHIVSSKVGSVRSGSFFWYLARTLLKPSARKLARSSAAMRTVLNSIPGMTASQAAFAYILSNTQVNSCVFGTTSLSNLKDILGSIDLELDEASKNAIRDTFAALSCAVSV
jgi:aryl-alcohol dehydrogenase-like predicted oxidoreductase